MTADSSYFPFHSFVFSDQEPVRSDVRTRNVAVASLPRQSLDIHAAMLGFQRLFAAMRFVASPVGRDPRLDLLRGLCVFAMIVDHIGGVSWLYVLTGGNTGPVTAAEGFVFLSGLVLGIVSRKRVDREGVYAAARSALARAWTLYALSVVLRDQPAADR